MSASARNESFAVRSGAEPDLHRAHADRDERDGSDAEPNECNKEHFNGDIEDPMLKPDSDGAATADYFTYIGSADSVTVDTKEHDAQGEVIDPIEEEREVAALGCARCGCEEDHEEYDLRQSPVTNADWISLHPGCVYGHGCKPSAYLRMKQAQLDHAAASIMADKQDLDHLLFWLADTRDRRRRAEKDYEKMSQGCRCGKF